MFVVGWLVTLGMSAAGIGDAARLDSVKLKAESVLREDEGN